MAASSSTPAGGTTPTVSTAVRRVRLGHRHRLAERVDGVLPAVDAVVALHGTDPATVFLSPNARMVDPSIEAVEAALFTDRHLMRTLAMRRTLWVPTVNNLRTVEVSSAPAIAHTERKRLEKFLLESDITKPTEWLDAARAEVLAALDDGPLTARSITPLVPRLATKLVMGAGTKHAVRSGATSRTLGLLAVEGHIARGKPAGSWTGRQYVWHRRDQWIPIPPEDPAPDVAAAALAESWLRSFGPGTLTDLQWWTGWTKTATRAALALLDITQVLLEDEAEIGLILSDDMDDIIGKPGTAASRKKADATTPWVSLLPSLDPTSMGWKRRGWYVGDHTDALFDQFGNIGPAVWLNGRIVGVWSQNTNGALAWVLFEKLDRTQRGLLAREAERLSATIGNAVIKPSFPTPAQKMIAAQDRAGAIAL